MSAAAPAKCSRPRSSRLSQGTAARPGIHQVCLPAHQMQLILHHLQAHQVQPPLLLLLHHFQAPQLSCQVPQMQLIQHHQQQLPQLNMLLHRCQLPHPCCLLHCCQKAYPQILGRGRQLSSHCSASTMLLAQPTRCCPIRCMLTWPS